LTKPKVPRLAVLSVAILGLVALTAAPAGAAPTPQAPPGEQIVLVDGAGTVSVPISGLTKQEWLDKYGASTVAPSSSGTLTSSGYASGPYGPQSFYTTGHTHWSYSCTLGCSAAFSSSTSLSEWLGDPPFNANDINASMKWWLSGIDISVQIPPGVGFTKSGSGLIWQPGDVQNTWRVSLNYSAAIHMTAFVISSVHFTDQADIRLGSSWYHVQGN